MSAYLVVEFTVKDPKVYRDHYSANAGKTAKKYGAEPVAGGNWEVLDGDPLLSKGAIMRFPDRQAALDWYNSPEYQDLIEVRGVGMDARFSLVEGIPDTTPASVSRTREDVTSTPSTIDDSSARRNK